MNEQHAPHRLGDLRGKTHPVRRGWLWLFMLVVLCIGVYVCDYLSVRYRIPNNRESFEVVKIQRYYAVHLKNGKTELDFQEPETQGCVDSLFPHFGYSPCWYVKWRKVKRIDL